MVRWVSLVVFGVVGCVLPKESAVGPTEGADTGVSTPPEEDAITWYEHVKPMMAKHCTRCHYDNGLAVGDFNDAELVHNFAEIMLARMDSGAMPPPVSDPECRDYVGSEHLQIPAETRDLFAAWIDGGKVEGDPSDEPEVALISEELTDANMTIQMEQPYTPLFEDPENPGNEYRCFVLDPELEENVYITGLAPLLGEKSMVHHIVLFTKSADEIAPEDLGPDGYDCIDAGMADGVTGMIAGWAPGALPVEFPSGYGMRLGPNDRLVLQMHYYQSGPEVVGVADQSGYAFRVVDEVERSVLMYPIGTRSFTIPAGEPAYTDGFEWRMPDYLNFSILAVFPHMHMLGSGYKMWVDSAEDGYQCLAESAQYDFDNQLTYMFKEPVPVQGGDMLGFECTWDNSADNPNQYFDEPQDIRYGERTNEEMCFTFTLVGL